MSEPRSTRCQKCHAVQADGRNPDPLSLEHPSESVRICGKGKRSNSMARSNFTHFGLHSGRTEENGQGASRPDAREQLGSAVRVIAINDDSGKGSGLDDIGYRLPPSEKPRLETSDLNHKSQQRSDDLLARENQHIAQRRQPNNER